MKKLLLLCLLTIMLGIVPIQALATPITFTDGLGGSAKFDVVGGNLVITLSSTRDADENAEVLMALFFSVSGVPSLTPVSATVPSGETILTWPSTTTVLPASRDVGHEWAYDSGLSGIPGGGTQGISAAGLNLFGPGELINPAGTDWYVGGNDPNGGDYGLTGGNQVTSNGYGELVKNETVFILSGIPGGFDPFGSITNVYIHYGTTLETTQVPEPNTLLLLGLGLVGIVGIRRIVKG